MWDFRTHKKYNLHAHLKGIHGISNIKEQSTQIQNGLGTTYIPIEKYKEVCNATDQWKICYEKLQKEHTLLQEHRREDGVYFMKRIYYLQNLLNNYNINYEKYEWNNIKFSNPKVGCFCNFQIKYPSGLLFTPLL